jgi:hypothetical protein
MGIAQVKVVGLAKPRPTLQKNAGPLNFKLQGILPDGQVVTLNVKEAVITLSEGQLRITSHGVLPLCARPADQPASPEPTLIPRTRRRAVDPDPGFEEPFPVVPKRGHPTNSPPESERKN